MTRFYVQHQPNDSRDIHLAIQEELLTSRGRSHHLMAVIRRRRSLEMAAQGTIHLGIEKLSRIDLGALRRH